MSLLHDSHLELAKKAYDRPETKTINEFVEDYSRFKNVKRLLSLYKNTGEINTRLVLNHLILIFNVFDKEIALCILYEANKAHCIPALNSFLLFMNQITGECELDGRVLKELTLI